MAASVPIRQLSLSSLVGVIFFIVCGGTYGLESAIKEAGAWWTIVLVVAIPFLWGLPIALMVAELAALSPMEGGYYTWVRMELGNFWGCQIGWWALCAAIVDMALYPALFVRYASHIVPSLQLDAPWVRWLVGGGFIGVALGLNLSGVRTVGRNALLTLILVMTPLLLFSGIVLWQRGPGEIADAVLRTTPGEVAATSFATGLSIVIWNFMGWDSASTIAGEVKNPQRVYPRALALAGLLSVAIYLIPLLAGWTVFPDTAKWSEWTVWSNLGERVAGAWLGVVIAVAGLVAQWSLFNSNLLYSSRIPYAMARDGWLPAMLARTQPRGGAPAAALCALAVVAAILTSWPFEKLVVVDVLLLSAVLAAEFVVLIRLRLREPAKARPFRIPGGWAGITAVTLAPAACAAMLVLATLSGTSSNDSPSQNQQLMAVGMVVSGGIVLYLMRRRVAGKKTQARL